MRTIPIALAFWLCALPAAADSDGHFCIGPGYLAYQLHFDTAPHTHRLYVMRFDDPERWTHPARIDLPPFNAPPMRCEAQRIALAAWDAIHYVSWPAEAPSRLSLRSEPKSPGPSDTGLFPDTIGSVVLGVPGERGTYTARLPSADPVNTYVLRVSRQPDAVRPCTIRVRASVARYAGDAILEEYDLFSGEMPAECGD